MELFRVQPYLWETIRIEGVFHGQEVRAKARSPQAVRSKGRGRRAAGTPEAPAESVSARSPGSSARDRVIDALMELAAERPWSDIEIPDIADAAGVSLSEFRDLFPSKGAILAGFSKRIDKIVLEGTTDDLEGEPVRERLFDVIMRRSMRSRPTRRR